MGWADSAIEGAVWTGLYVQPGCKSRCWTLLVLRVGSFAGAAMPVSVVSHDESGNISAFA